MAPEGLGDIIIQRNGQWKKVSYSRANSWEQFEWLKNDYHRSDVPINPTTGFVPKNGTGTE